MVPNYEDIITMVTFLTDRKNRVMAQRRWESVALGVRSEHIKLGLSVNCQEWLIEDCDLAVQKTLLNKRTLRHNGFVIGTPVHITEFRGYFSGVGFDPLVSMKGTLFCCCLF